MAHRHEVEVLALAHGDAGSGDDRHLIVVLLLALDDALGLAVVAGERPVEGHAIGELLVSGTQQHVRAPVVDASSVLARRGEGVAERGQDATLTVLPHHAEVRRSDVPIFLGIGSGVLACHFLHEYRGARSRGVGCCFCVECWRRCHRRHHTDCGQRSDALADPSWVLVWHRYLIRSAARSVAS